MQERQVHPTRRKNTPGFDPTRTQSRERLHEREILEQQEGPEMAMTEVATGPPIKLQPLHHSGSTPRQQHPSHGAALHVREKGDEHLSHVSVPRITLEEHPLLQKSQPAGATSASARTTGGGGGGMSSGYKAAGHKVIERLQQKIAEISRQKEKNLNEIPEVQTAREVREQYKKKRDERVAKRYQPATARGADSSKKTTTTSLTEPKKSVSFSIKQEQKLPALPSDNAKGARVGHNSTQRSSLVPPTATSTKGGDGSPSKQKKFQIVIFPNGNVWDFSEVSAEEVQKSFPKEEVHNVDPVAARQCIRKKLAKARQRGESAFLDPSWIITLSKRLEEDSSDDEDDGPGTGGLVRHATIAQQRRGTILKNLKKMKKQQARQRFMDQDSPLLSAGGGPGWKKTPVGGENTALGPTQPPATSSKKRQQDQLPPPHPPGHAKRMSNQFGDQVDSDGDDEKEPPNTTFLLTGVTSPPALTSKHPTEPSHQGQKAVPLPAGGAGSGPNKPTAARFQKPDLAGSQLSLSGSTHIVALHLLPQLKDCDNAAKYVEERISLVKQSRTLQLAFNEHCSAAKQDIRHKFQRSVQRVAERRGRSHLEPIDFSEFVAQREAKMQQARESRIEQHSQRKEDAEQLVSSVERQQERAVHMRDYLHTLPVLMKRWGVNVVLHRSTQIIREKIKEGYLRRWKSLVILYMFRHWVIQARKGHDRIAMLRFNATIKKRLPIILNKLRVKRRTAAMPMLLNFLKHFQGAVKMSRVIRRFQDRVKFVQRFLRRRELATKILRFAIQLQWDHEADEIHRKTSWALPTEYRDLVIDKMIKADNIKHFALRRRLIDEYISDLETAEKDEVAAVARLARAAQTSITMMLPHADTMYQDAIANLDGVQPEERQEVFCCASGLNATTNRRKFVIAYLQDCVNKDLGAQYQRTIGQFLPSGSYRAHKGTNQQFTVPSFTLNAPDTPTAGGGGLTRRQSNNRMERSMMDRSTRTAVPHMEEPGGGGGRRASFRGPANLNVQPPRTNAAQGLRKRSVAMPMEANNAGDKKRKSVGSESRSNSKSKVTEGVRHRENFSLNSGTELTGPNSAPIFAEVQTKRDPYDHKYLPTDNDSHPLYWLFKKVKRPRLPNRKMLTSRDAVVKLITLAQESFANEMHKHAKKIQKIQVERGAAIDRVLAQSQKAAQSLNKKKKRKQTLTSPLSPSSPFGGSKSAFHASVRRRSTTALDSSVLLLSVSQNLQREGEYVVSATDEQLLAHDGEAIDSIPLDPKSVDLSFIDKFLDSIK